MDIGQKIERSGATSHLKGRMVQHILNKQRLNYNQSDGMGAFPCRPNRVAIFKEFFNALSATNEIPFP